MSDELFNEFEALRTSILAFTRDIDSNKGEHWLANWNGLNQSSTVDDILFDLWYHEDQDGRETRVYPGLIGLSRQQMTYANEINLAKDRFRALVQTLKQQDNNNWREIQGAMARRYQALNETLTRDGLNRLHLKQVFRHIPLVVNRQEKVGLGWYSSGRSINRIDKKDAYVLLCKLNTEATHIKIQLERLAAVKEGEFLARVQKQAPVLRANIVYADKKRRSMNVSLPLFYPHEGRTDLPEFNIPPVQPPSTRSRLIRSDNKIEDEPFLPSIRVHRYNQKTKKSYY